ncbi:MAG: ATP-dependent DNA helicase RecQ [Bacteroidota bacterium]
MSPSELLKKYWGYATFRPLQEDIIEAVLENRDVLALLPTGGGKSICFQVPALVRKGLCIVVSPLIALMKDQVSQLRKRGIPAENIFAGMRHSEIDTVLDNCVYGPTKFLYVSPERLQTTLLQERVKRMAVNLLAVDEAHCISQWGYDFRPAYLEIAGFRALLPHVNVIALTATATSQVQRDVCEKLQLQDCIRFQKSFTRPNLAYVVRKTENPEAQLRKILHNIPGTAIVYANTRKKTQIIAQALRKHGIDATAYHAGLTAAERSVRQETWMQSKTKVMVATNAFGMGIDKPDVRLVVHWDLPTTLEAYYQEAGRAGRDEQAAYAVALYEDNTLRRLRENIRAAHPTIGQLKKVYQHLANYYQVAVGSHVMTTYDFDIEDFAQAYGLAPHTAYQAVKTLEGEGLVQLDEAFSQPAQLRIIVSPKELYAFQVAYAKYDALVKALLRLYGGELLSNYCTISEQRIARFLGIELQDIKQQLKVLEQHQIVRYSAQKDYPQLTFTIARQPMNALSIDTKKLQQRTQIAVDKVEAVIHYVTHSHRCRAQLLLEYFGEVTYEACGQCDVCLAKKKSGVILTEQEFKQYRGIVLQCLHKGKKSLSKVVDSADLAAEEIILSTIRQMLDNGELTYDKVGDLTIKEIC